MRKILTCKVDFLRRDGERRSSFWQIRSVRLCLSTRSLINIDGPLALMRGLRRKRGYVLYTSRVQPCDLARLIVTCILRDYSVPIRDRAPPRSLSSLSPPNYRSHRDPRRGCSSILHCKLNDYNRLNIWKSSNIPSWLKITLHKWIVLVQLIKDKRMHLKWDRERERERVV